jgi:RNA-directed DNA polymerase
MGMERRGYIDQPYELINQKWEESVNKEKPFNISKGVVWEAYRRVKANRGAAGVDAESIADFEKELKGNLYKIWNRMSSGSYFPPPVRAVVIPKDKGGQRVLGFPTVADRVAQMVVKIYLEPKVEPVFHPDSYGYRPGKSAIEAVGRARQRCWRHNWVLDSDIKGFFDNIDHELLMRAVRKHTESKWIRLYVERWLKAPVQQPDGTLVQRDKGTPQGGVVSPLLANLFLHYAFDDWMRRRYPGVPFERYADDIIVHCKTETEAKHLKAVIGERLGQCELELHLEKTKIVYCKDDNRRGSYSDEKFDFLGFTFRSRQTRSRGGKYFVAFSPAISNEAAKSIQETVRGWKLHRRSDKTITDLARMYNPIIRGWINYYGSYYKSALNRVFLQLVRSLMKWAMKKYKKLRGRLQRATHWLGRIAQREPNLFAHWQMGMRPAAGQ